MTEHSKAKEILSYSFLVAFAHSDSLEMHDLEMIEKLALDDRVVDDEVAAFLRKYDI